ncbi:GMC oxidoreductase [Sporormia fimetaria CBS 119925]|uniref:GMC oxidoreductase n=1 Tax=Sporormia fimetaria CBS 119925 TaxID=1340428 RepID=A0A6A6VFT2_9PLEO|nr:GMC oxidoreductase [Sporormia fimetaria CBS 119925]
MAASRNLRVVFVAFLFTALAANASIAAKQNETYDYVIVGGGTSGLVIANRLTENKDVTVLVIENGGIDDRPATKIPALAQANTENYYPLQSAPEPFMRNRTWRVSVGNVVGGGTVINGMQFDRGADADYDAWEELGNPGWGWKGLQKYFTKFVTFQAPSKEVTKKFNITYDKSVYGNGPVKVSIPSFHFPDLKDALRSWKEDEDVPYEVEGYKRPVGVFWTPNTIDNTTKERCSAKTAYYDPIKSRPNLRLLTNTHVDQILFEDKGKKLTAIGVKATTSGSSSPASFYARREVILAAGAIFTPHLLMASGVGPAKVLSAANVSVKYNLPGVGANLQDHPALYMAFNVSNLSFPNPSTRRTNATYEAAAAAEYAANKTGPYTSAGNNMLAFPPFKYVSEKYEAIKSAFLNQDAASFLPDSYSKGSTLLNGFLEQRKILASRYLSSDAAVSEHIVNAGGGATLALQKPLSRGTITLNSTHPHAFPIVVRNAFQNPVDKAVLAEAVRFNRRHYTNAPSLRKFSPVENVPGAEAVTDDDIFEASMEKAILNPSFAHSSGGCSMMPLEFGGCVDHELKVYGTKGLRVVDASIMPLIPAQHLQATVYAVAEKAADIIKGT